MVAREGARVLASLRTPTEALATVGRLQPDIAISPCVRIVVPFA